MTEREFVQCIADYREKVARFNPILTWALEELSDEQYDELERRLCEAANAQAAEAQEIVGGVAAGWFSRPKGE